MRNWLLHFFPSLISSEFLSGSINCRQYLDKDKPAADTIQHGIRSIDKKLKTLLKNTIEDAADDTGWVSLGVVENLISKKMPDFDSRNYGYKKLSSMMKSLNDILKIEERQPEGKSTKHIYVRNKQ